MNTRHKLGLVALALVLCLLPGCAWWQKTGKPIARTVDDVARSMCAMFYGQQNGISVDDAARFYCKTRESWAPWIDPALASMKAGGAQASQQGPVGGAAGKAGQ